MAISTAPDTAAPSRAERRSTAPAKKRRVKRNTGFAVALLAPALVLLALFTFAPGVYAFILSLQQRRISGGACSAARRPSSSCGSRTTSTPSRTRNSGPASAGCSSSRASACRRRSSSPPSSRSASMPTAPGSWACGASRSSCPMPCQASSPPCCGGVPLPARDEPDRRRRRRLLRRHRDLLLGREHRRVGASWASTWWCCTRRSAGCRVRCTRPPSSTVRASCRPRSASSCP